MTSIRRVARFAVAVALLPILEVQRSFAWGADGHRMVNRLAVANLPPDVPAFLRDGEALDTLEYLGPEPDRWKGKGEPELNAEQSPDHFIDMEWADYADIPCTVGRNGCPASGRTLPIRRYDYLRELARAQAAHPDLKLTPEGAGMQPWQVQEIYQRLKAEFREYRKLVAANQDTKPDETAILFCAGWLGHYVGDGSQPLHTTIQYNGWTGPNPDGYTVEHRIHAQFETIYVTANVAKADVGPLVAAAKPKVLSDEWNDYLGYLRHSNSLVERTYQLEKAGAFTGPGTPEGKAFVDERLAAGAVELRDLIYTAWVKSADPVEEYRGPQ